MDMGLVGRNILAVVLSLALTPTLKLLGEEVQTKVLTYNIRFANPNDGPDRWELRRDSVAQVINQADVVGLQEVLVTQLEDLRQRSPAMDWYGVGRDDGQAQGEFSPIGYRRDLFDLIGSGTFWLSENPDQVGVRGWDAALPRIASWVKIRDRRTGELLVLLNTHFDHRGSVARTHSAILIRNRLPQIAQDAPAVVMGDFNATPFEDPYKQIVVSFDPVWQLHDARSMSRTPPQGPEGTWNGFASVDSKRRIDHVFVTNTLQVVSYQVLDPRTGANRFASDHLPVLVVVE